MDKTVMAPTASVVTLGCRVNQYESAAICERLRAEGFIIVPPGSGAEVTVVNTCAVTAESGRKSRQMIRRAAAENPDGCVIVTGCLAELEAEDLSRFGRVAGVFGNGSKEKIALAALGAIKGNEIPGTIDVPDVSLVPYDGLTVTEPQKCRSYVKIEDGCENKCAYCVIPKVRGRVRSKSEDDVLREVEAQMRAGCREIILTGIETGSYGEDRRVPGGERPLASLIRRIDALGVERIGFGSLDPSVMDDKFIETLSSLRGVLPHFHLSVQSGSSSVLRRMRRRYNADMLRDRIAALRCAIDGVTLSADVIVGFPGETEEEFLETVGFFRETKFLHLHVFPYSSRPLTEAASMEGQLGMNEKRDRLRRLSAAEAEIKNGLLREYVERHREDPVKVLVEKEENGTAVGHSEHYVEVEFSGGKDDVAEIRDAILTGITGDRCVGKMI